MPKAQTHKKWKYDLHPSVRMVQSVIAGMKEKTGHSLDEWVRLVEEGGSRRRKGTRRVAEERARTGHELCFVDRRPFRRERRGRTKMPANI